MEIPENADDNCARQFLEWSWYTNASSCNIPSIKKRFISQYTTTCPYKNSKRVHML